ncbi:LGFP repeat-containing protein [Mycolicibacterium litorale]|uniref:LGFP repeat-containing protein n=1 Tax=Mycolicibacterium litorale TaxID=758802 RepID=UPI003CE8DEAB
MSGRRTLLRTALARVTVGLAAVVAAGLLMAPVAAADPVAEANDAITAAYDASGGPGGPLGVREGGVYPVGEGFGQNFAAGKMFFTPATGAHWMQGAILEKYESLGGPADSDLGFPTIDEGPGRVGPDSRNTTFSAADKPVIFWTPATGARVVRGALNAAWDRLGGSAGVLGVPAEDEVYRGDVASQKFTGGELTWNRKDRTFTTVPPELVDQLKDLSIPEDPTSAIAAARRAAGGPLGPLGAKEGEQYPIGDDGAGQNYAGGKIFYTPQTGANVVTGQVLEKYESVGGPEGDLGFPTQSEADGGLGSNSRISTFAAEDRPVIFWTPDYGAVIVRGAMNAGWSKLDGAKGPLGAPVADQTENGDVVTQRFSEGVLSYDRSTGRFSTEPANLAAQLAGLDVPGEEVPKAPAKPQSSAAQDDSGDWLSWRWNWWWLLALIPVLLVVGLVVGAVLWSRRRGRRDDRFRDDEDLFDRAMYEPVGRTDFGEGDDDRRRYPDEPATAFGFHDAPPATSAADPWEPRTESAEAPAPADEPAAPVPGPDDPFAAQDDPDSVDTAPTRIEEPQAQSALEEPSLPVPGESSPPEEATEREPQTPESAETESSRTESSKTEAFAAAPFVVAPFVEDAPSGRHAAIDIDEPAPGRTAIHLPLDDSGAAPEGYPVKADTRTGLYWAPGSPGYDDVAAEIYFASEEFARTNGFVRGD